MPLLAAPVLASIIGGGAAIGGSLIAKSGATSVANQQQQQANQLLQRSAPAYNAAQNYYQSLLTGNPNQVASAIAPDINATTMQFNQARQNLINSSMSRGGGLDAGLANLEAGKAATLSNLISSVRPGAAAALGNLANNQSIQGLSALAGAQQSQVQNSQLQSQALGGIGSFITRLVAGFGNSNGGGSGSNYFGVNMNSNSGGGIPAAVLPGTGGSMFPGATEPFPSQIG